jgi:uncharacterized protein (TIGR03437 family)
MPCHTTIKVFIQRFVPFLGLSFLLSSHLPAQNLSIVSGNGQIAFNSLFTQNVRMVVQAKDANGKPVKGVGITWSIQGTGTLFQPTLTTDSNGQASTLFLNSSLPPFASFLMSTVTAASSNGSVNFFVTTVPLVDNMGQPAQQPQVDVLAPDLGSTLTGQVGTTLPGAVKVQVRAGAGVQANAPLPNVSVRIVNSIDPSSPSPAHCNAANGVVLTDKTGTAICDLVIDGPAGSDAIGISAVVGEFHQTAAFYLQVKPGASCRFTLASASESFGSAGGNGTVDVATASTCGWTAVSNASWITITGGASGTGDGTVSYTVAADTGSPRNGTFSISGNTFTVTQGSGKPGSLAITTPSNLPGGTVNLSYATTLSASGGIPPYTWSISSGALPPGLTLDSSTGIIGGIPTSASETPYKFQATVTDNAGSTLPQNFSVTINSPSSSTFRITTPSLPNGIVGQSYQQPLATVGGVVTPFNQNPAFQVSGGALPDGLKLVKNSNASYSIAGTPTTPGVSNLTLTATDAAGNATSANFTLTITGTPTSQQMMVAPASISFTVQLGAMNVPADQTIAITGSSFLSYTSVVTTTSGGSWLIAKNATSGNTPGGITLAVTNFSDLAAGPYTGALTVSSVAANSPVVVQVTLTVLAAPTLTATPSTISVSQGISNGHNITQQTIQLASVTDSLQFTAAATTDKGGNWLTVTPTTGATPTKVTAAIDSGGLALGTYTGNVVITPSSGGPLTIPVTLNVINPAKLSAAPAPLAFTYSQGATLPDFQVVTVTSSGGTLTVTAAVATQRGGNWLLVNPPGGQTSLNLSVSVNPSGLAPGTYSGIITITASDTSVLPLQIVVMMTVNPAAPTVTGVTNAASFAPGPVAPGEIVTLFGTAIGPATGVSFQVTSSGTIPLTLSDTQVFFDDHPAALLYTSAGQISAIVPYEVAGHSATNVHVEYKGTASSPVPLRVTDSVPGIFTLGASGQGAILNQDFSINSTKNGAEPGSVVSIYATGEGQTAPGGKDGALSGDVLPLPAPLLKVTVKIGGLDADVAYAGAAPLEPAGVLQVNAKVPGGVPRGTSVPVTITVGSASSQAGVTVAIK